MRPSWIRNKFVQPNYAFKKHDESVMWKGKSYIN